MENTLNSVETNLLVSIQQYLKYNDLYKSYKFAIESVNEIRYILTSLGKNTDIDIIVKIHDEVYSSISCKNVSRKQWMEESKSCEFDFLNSIYGYGKELFLDKNLNHRVLRYLLKAINEYRKVLALSGNHFEHHSRSNLNQQISAIEEIRKTHIKNKRTHVKSYVSIRV